MSEHLSPDDGWMHHREMALAEWRQQREEREFAALLKRIYDLNHYHSRRKMCPRHRAYGQAYSREWRRRNPEKVKLTKKRQNERIKKANALKEKRAFECDECKGKSETIFPNQRFCTQSCRQAWHLKNQRKGIRNSHIEMQIAEALRRNPSLTLNGLVEETKASKSSIKNALKRMLDKGKVAHDGKRRNRRYALTANQNEAMGEAE